MALSSPGPGGGTRPGLQAVLTLPVLTLPDGSLLLAVEPLYCRSVMLTSFPLVRTEKLDQLSKMQMEAQSGRRAAKEGGARRYSPACFQSTDCLNRHTKLNTVRSQVLYLIWSKILAKRCSGSKVLLHPKTLKGHEGCRNTMTWQHDDISQSGQKSTYQ